MISIDVIKFLKKKGFETIGADWYTRIKMWGEWYTGKTTFHQYMRYNGTEYVSCRRKSLGMAKKVSEDKADLLLNERVSITIGSGEDKSAEQEFIDDVLDKNNFWVSGNQLMEFTAALGVGAFVEYLNDKDEPRIDFVQGACIYPIHWMNGVIYGCAFASIVGGTAEKPITYINIHVKVNGKYVVYNYYVEGENKEVELPKDMLPEWNTGSEAPMYQIVKLNIANNIDTTSPMGISVFANAADVIESLDLIYDSYYNEFKLGKKRVFVKDSMLKLSVKDGKTVPIFDSNDTEFYGLPGESAADISQNLQEVNGDLRAEAHQRAIQDNLDILSDKVGFGKGYYKFTADGVKTATEVVSQNSKLYRKIKRDEIILDKVLKDMVRALLFLGKKKTDMDISINFDDSIIEDTDAEAKRALLELQAGAIDRVRYHEIVSKLTEEAAIALVTKMDERAPAAPEFNMGG